MHGQFRQTDQRGLGHGRDAAGHGGQAEFFHAQIAAGVGGFFAFAVFANQLQPVLSQLGRFGNGPLALGHLTAGGIAAPGNGQVDALVATGMDDAQKGGVLLGCTQALGRCVAEEMLHRNRFSGAQQAAIQHGVRHGIQLGIGAGRHVEAPGLNAPVPVAPHEGHIGDALFIGCAGTDEQFFFVIIRAGQRLQVLPNAAGIGLAAGQQFTVFVADGNRCIGHGLAGIE